MPRKPNIDQRFAARLNAQPIDPSFQAQMDTLINPPKDIITNQPVLTAEQQAKIDKADAQLTRFDRALNLLGDLGARFVHTFYENQTTKARALLYLYTLPNGKLVILEHTSDGGFELYGQLHVGLSIDDTFNALREYAK